MISSFHSFIIQTNFASRAHYSNLEASRKGIFACGVNFIFDSSFIVPYAKMKSCLRTCGIAGLLSTLIYRGALQLHGVTYIPPSYASIKLVLNH